MGTDLDQTWDREGNLISSVEVERPAKVIDPATFDAAKQNIRTYWQTFTQNGAPTGTPTANQNRNAILSLIVAARWLYDEMDNEETP